MIENIVPLAPKCSKGSAIAQAVSRRLPKAAVRVRFQVTSCGIFGGPSSTGAAFLLAFQFLCQFSFHQILHTHLSSVAGTTGQLVADVASGLSLTPPHEIKSSKRHLPLRVFRNRVWSRILGPKRDEVKGGWRKLHNEELRNLYISPSIIRMIKSRRMR
jgi:hypothetical protein